MKTPQELIEHMQKENARNIFIVGPFVGDYKIMTPEEAEVFKLKGLVKQKEEFFRILTEKVQVNTNNFVNEFVKLKKFIGHTYMQNVNGFMINDTTYLKGNSWIFECSKCHTEPELMLPDKHFCDECGGHLRPKCLLGGEKYDMNIIQAFEEDLLTATTVFLIGFDFNELELCKQLEVIAARKNSGDPNMPIVVVVGECDKEAVFETFLPEFIVDEKPETALKRLAEFINVE